MPPKATEKFTVAGVEIIVGNSYEVRPKKDFDAPSGFQDFNTTKLLAPGISEHRAITFNSDMHIWDTGFDIDSPVNLKIAEADRKAEVTIYNKLVKKPYEDRYRKDLSSTNNDFWDNFTYELYTYKVFDTSKELDRLELFLALQNGRVCQIGEKNATLQRNANYHIRSREKETSMKEERAKTKFKAYSTFGTLLNLDHKKDDTLYLILEWMNVSGVRGADKDALESMVLRMFEDEKTGFAFAERFLNTFNESESEIGGKRMEIFSVLQQLKAKNKLTIKRSQYYLDDVKIGNSLKEATETALINPDIKELVEKAYSQIT